MMQNLHLVKWGASVGALIPVTSFAWPPEKAASILCPHASTQHREAVLFHEVVVPVLHHEVITLSPLVSVNNRTLFRRQIRIRLLAVIRREPVLALRAEQIKLHYEIGRASCRERV